MLKLLKELDRILRGEATSLPSLREGTVRFPLAGITFVLFVLGMIYGFCMGWFALFNRVETATGQPEWQQVIAAMIKVPALFLLTLIVTFPSLYVFNTLVGSRLRGAAVLRLLIASLAVTLAVLASFGPIVAFFSVTTDSYSFMVLLNVMLFAVAGVLGCMFLLQTLHRLSVAADWDDVSRSAPAQTPAETPLVQTGNEPVSAASRPVRPPGAIDRLQGHVLGTHVRSVFRIWILVYGLVGAQMAWVLRPFIGTPGRPFTWLREREANFFQSVIEHIGHLFR